MSWSRPGRVRWTQLLTVAVALTFGVLGMVEIWAPLPSRNFTGDRWLTGLSVRGFVTNVVKHADATSVTVLIDYRSTELLVSVSDDGAGLSRTGSAVPGDGSGHGLAGMRERLASYGGRLRTINGPGFTVGAVIPTAP